MPVVAWCLALASASAAEPVALERYKREYLYRDKLQYSVTTGFAGAYGGSVATRNVFAWAVYDGGGQMLPTEDFITRVGDDDGLRRYRAGMARRTSLGTTLAAVGVGAFAVGITGMFLPLLTDSDDLTPLWVGTGVAAVSSVPIGIGFGQFIFNQRHRRFVYEEYEVTEADQWIDQHNASLREELGLELGDVVELTR